MNQETEGGILMQDPIEIQEKYAPEILPLEEIRGIFPLSNKVARYNAAVLGSKEGAILLAREVPLGTVKAGQPDMGDLGLYRVTPDNPVERIAVLKLFHPDIINWEDARAFQLGEKVILGLTAIRRSDNKPVAATARGSVIDGNFVIEDGSLTVYSNDEGKNVTPISPTEFLFRREGFKNSLEVVEAGLDANGQNKLMVKKIIEFPKRSWYEWQIGTQAQMLPGGILPIHGVNRFSLGINPQTGEEGFRYEYSLGLAQLDENLNVSKVTDTPLFNRDSFSKVLPKGIELDTNKDVIYCCGYSVDKGIVKFVINIGDLMTVEVSKSLAELQEALDNSSAIEIEQFPESIAA